MNALVVYEAMWGNTREITEGVVAGLEQYAEVTTVDVTEAPSTVPVGVDLVVVGGPTHAFDGQLRAWLDQIPASTTAPVFALFEERLGITRALPHGAGRKAAKSLADRGHQIIAEPHSFYVHSHNGPLESGERCRASLWGERVALETQLAQQPV